MCIFDFCNRKGYVFVERSMVPPNDLSWSMYETDFYVQRILLY